MHAKIINFFLRTKKYIDTRLETYRYMVFDIKFLQIVISAICLIFCLVASSPTEDFNFFHSSIYGKKENSLVSPHNLNNSVRFVVPESIYSEIFFLSNEAAEEINFPNRLALQIFSKAMGPKSDLRNSKEFCNKLMYELADFVGSSKITGCSAQCRSACGNMWDINSKDGDRCERQCRLCWNVLEYEPNDCKSVSPYPMVLPDKI